MRSEAFSNKNQQNQLSEKIFSGNSLDIKSVPSWFPKASLTKTSKDLIATSPDGKQIEFIDYFTNFDLPSIYTENGLFFKGSLIEALVGPLVKGKFAQAAGQQNLSIGEVSSVSGSAQATRIDGTTFSLSNGDPVFQGDQIEVSSSGAVGLVFLDKTTLSLSEGGKMILDELVYDPSSGTGSMAIDMVEGAFSFVSGEIAKTGPDAMKVSTPVATIGIRGTTVAGKAAVEGNENSFTLLQDADGGVGQISVSNDGGTQVLAQVGATTSITSFTAPPPPPIILTAAQIQADYGTALNVLPPTPVIAPTPQPPPPSQEQQQEQQVQEETQDDDAVSEEGTTEDEEELPDGEEVQEGEEGLPEGEDSLDEEGGSLLDSDGETLSDDESLPEDEGDSQIGVDGEPLPTDDNVSTIGQDGEILSDGPPIGPDGEILESGEFGASDLGPEGDPLTDGPPIGPDGEPLAPGNFGLDGPTPEQDAAAREAFETALASGLSPEEAMAEAAAVAGIPPPPEGFGGDPLANTVGGEDFAGDPFAPNNFGPGGPEDFSPSEFSDFGSGGFEPSASGDFGDFSPDGPAGFADFDLGGPEDFGSGDFGDFGSGGPGVFSPNGLGGFDSENFEDLGPIDLPEGESVNSVASLPGTFLPPGSFSPPGTIQQPGAYIPAQVGFAPVSPVTTAPVIGSGFSGEEQGDFYGGDYEYSGEDVFMESGEYGSGDLGPAGLGSFGSGDFGSGSFGSGYAPAGNYGFESYYGGFDSFYENSYYSSDSYDYYYDASDYDDYDDYDDYYDDSGSSSSSSGSSTTTYTGSSSADSEDKSAETDAWTFEGYSGDDTFSGGSGNDVFWGAIGNDTLTGNGGQDVFYFQDFTEGKDTITDFQVGASGDALKFGSSFASAYTRDSTLVDDTGANGSTYDMSNNSSVLPKIFNFSNSFATASSSTGVVSQLTSFVVTSDGSNPISSSADFILVTATASDSYVYGWSDSGNGVIDGGELFNLAVITGIDNDNITASDFTFGSI